MHQRLVRHAPPPRRRSSAAAVIGGTVVALAAAALVNGARARAAIRANPPLGDFVDIDGVAVHYLDRGPVDGATPTIVLIHGNGSMVQDFIVSGVVDRLAARHRVVVFDRPGSGYTGRPRDRAWTAQAQAALLVAAAAKIGVERPVVVGHSWGALPAIVWALDHADRIGALVLASGYYFPSARPDVLSVIPAVVPGVGDVLRHTVSPIVGRLSLPLGNRLIFSPSAVTPAWREQFPFELALRPSQLRATLADTAQMPLAAKSLVERYEDLRLPTVIIAGDGDRLVPFSGQSKRLAGMLPQARLMVIEGAGHMIQHIDPDRFVAAVEAASAAID